MTARRNIPQDRPPVNSRSVCFDGHGRLSDWETVPVFGGASLEAHIFAGDEEERRSARDEGHPYAVAVSVAKVPLVAWQSLYFLTTRLPKLVPTVAAASRYAARCGLEVLERIEALGELELAWDLVYPHGTATQRTLLSNQTYEGFTNLDSCHVACRKLSLFYKNQARIATMAAGLGLPTGTAALAAVVAGLAQSMELIPEPHLSTFARAICDFCHYLERRAAELRPLLAALPTLEDRGPNK